MGLIDLKTNLKSLKYGNDQQGGGSSGQPFIVTPIPEGYAPKSIDFLLRNGILNPADSITDAKRLTKFLASTNGILFTTKQIALERQNPKLVNTNRIYSPANTILQAGVLSTGTHLNKQGLNPSQPLSYFSGGTTGYYFTTKGIGENPLFQVLPNEDLENRLTIAYTAKIANQSLGGLTINPFGISTFNPNVLLSYIGGPNSALGLGDTNIRIQNPTIRLKDIYDDGDELAKERYDNPNQVSALSGQKFLSHKDPNWIYDITKQGVSFQYESLPDITPDQVYDSLFTSDYRTFILNRNTSTPQPPIYESNTINKNTDFVKLGEPDYLVPSGVNTSNIEWTYTPEKQGASAKYQKDMDFLLGEVEGGRILDTIFTDNPTSNLLKRPNENVTLFDNKKPSTEVYGEGIYAYTGEQIATQQGTDSTVNNNPDDPTPRVFSKTKSTYLDNLTDYRDIILKNLSSDVSSNATPLPSTNYSKFNREKTYSTSRTTYTLSNVDPDETNIDAGVADYINVQPPLTNKDDVEYAKEKDIIKFYFELIGNNSANSFLFFRAYLNSLSDSFSPQWDSYKYVGRAENFYKYNGFSRDINLEFTIYGHTRIEMIPIYRKLNALVGTTAPDYSSNLMKGNFIKLTIGDYLLDVPGFIKNITLTPSFEAGWDINRANSDGLLWTSDNGSLNVGQVPKLINVSLGFTPIHSFTPTNKSPYIRNI